jgi:hypothetical protein
MIDAGWCVHGFENARLQCESMDASMCMVVICISH